MAKKTAKKVDVTSDATPDTAPAAAGDSAVSKLKALAEGQGLSNRDAAIAALVDAVLELGGESLEPASGDVDPATGDEGGTDPA